MTDNIKEYVELTKYLSNLPPNKFKPSTAHNFLRIGKENSHKVVVENCPLVGHFDPQGHIVSMAHEGGSKTDPFISLIGKGVTFDTGGYNIKTRHMNEMKFDKCGAMACFSAFKYAVVNELKVNLLLTIPLMENTVSRDSPKPGDVITAFSGKTIEITDTDAEGRVALAGAIELIESYEPFISHHITVATLTGACHVALGDLYSGLFHNHTKRAAIEAQNLLAASKKSRDLVHLMPYHDKHLKKMKSSKVADIKNYAGKEYGGSSGFAFLDFFSTRPLVHLDIAGTAYKDEEATGRPTKALIHYLLTKHRESL